MTLIKLVFGGAIVSIVLGFLHAVHVGLAHNIEAYLWLVSGFLIVHGLLTVILIRVTVSSGRICRSKSRSGEIAR